MLRCPRCDWQETVAGAPARTACPKCGLPFGNKTAGDQRALNRTVLNFGAEPPAPVGAAQEHEQETTLRDSRRPSPTTKPPPAPFPELGGIDAEDEEMTRMEQVPPEVLAQLMARAQASEEPSPAPAAAAPPILHSEFTDDEPTRLGQELSELLSQAPAASVPTAPRRPVNATQLGVPSIAASQPPTAASAARNHATQLGVPQQPTNIPRPPRPLSSIPPPPLDPSQASASAPLAPAAPRRAMSGTLFGLQGSAETARASAPPPAPAPATTAPPVQSAPPPPLQPGQAAPRRVPNANPTLLGGVLASAASGARAGSSETPAPAAAPGTAMPPASPGAPWTPSIPAPPAPPAPPYPGLAANPVLQQTSLSAGPPAQFAQGNPPPRPEDAVAAASPKRSGVPLVVVLLLLAGVVAGGAFFALRWYQDKSGAGISASIDATGSDLELTCPTCADGTRVSLGGTFAAGKARVQLATPLTVGEQLLEAAIQAPDQPAKNVKIPVAVEFRIDLDTTALHTFPPVLTVHTQVRPGGTLSIAGSPATPTLTIPVGDAAKGPRETVTKVQLDVSYHYERDGLTPHDGAITQELNILPLRLFAPKDGTFTAEESVLVQGQAPPGIDVHVGDATLKPDEKGMFELARPLRVGPNEIPLWLSRSEPGPGGVTRGLVLNITRSATRATLWSSAVAAASYGPTLDIAPLYADPASQNGKRFEFAGAIVEAQTQRGETIALLDGSPAAIGLKAPDATTCKSSSCLLRVVVAAGSTRIAKGDKVRGIGLSVTPRDPKTPEIEAQLLLPLNETK